MVDPLPGGPIFLFTMHRSGGTLLQRIINSHPNVVIWGEHGGFISKLAEADAVLAHYPPVMSPLAKRDIQGFLVRRGAGHFDPWLQPFERSVFRQRSRDLILDSFSYGLSPGQRWGFKEIRYHSLTTALFLAELFPWSRFVILRRELKSVIASSILAPWSLKSLIDVRSHEDLEMVVRDCTRAARAMRAGLEAIAAALPERTFLIDFVDLANDKAREALFQFLALPLDDTIRSRAAVASSEKLGETPPGRVAGAGRLEIEAMAETAIHREANSDTGPPRQDYRYLMGWPLTSGGDQAGY